MAEAEGKPLSKFFAESFEEKLLGQTGGGGASNETFLTPGTRLLEKRREMADVQTDLESQKQDYYASMTALEQRRENLERKANSLTASLNRSDRIVKSNDTRKKRALTKAHTERESGLQKELEAVELKHEQSELRVDREKQRAEMETLEIYFKYLKAVLDTTEEYNEINELIDRYMTLYLTNKDLSELEVSSQQAMETRSNAHVRYLEAHKVAMMDGNNRLAHCEAELEKAVTEAMHWDNQAAHSEQNASKKTLMIGRVKMATANLYALVESHTKGSSGERSHATERQLEKIQAFCTDLRDVVLEYELALHNIDE